MLIQVPMHKTIRLLPVLTLLAACVATPDSKPDAESGEWLEPSAGLEEKIERNADRVPWTNVLDERVELIRWFAGVGEAAYPTLLELAADPRPIVSGTALAALGATRDPRLVEHVRALPATGSADIELEKARTLLMLGDWSQLNVLVRGLRDERHYTRAVSIRALREATQEDFGFDPSAEPEAREKAVAQWDSWWRTRVSDPLLAES